MDRSKICIYKQLNEQMYHKHIFDIKNIQNYEVMMTSQWRHMKDKLWQTKDFPKL